MIIERGTVDQYMEELKPLQEEHWEEIGLAGSDGLKLDIDYDYYRLLEKQRHYLGLVLKTDEGTLVGYLSIIIYKNYHHKEVLFASTDCFLVKKEYRGSSAFSSIVKMFKMAEKMLKVEFNVDYLQFGFSANNPLEVLAKRLGYVPSDIMYLKKLESV